MSYILAALKKSELEREQREAAASSGKASVVVDSVAMASSTSSSVDLTSRSLVISYAFAVIVLSSLFAYLLVKPLSQPHTLLAAVEEPIANKTVSEIQEVDVPNTAEMDTAEIKAEEVKAQEVKVVEVTKAQAQVVAINQTKVEAKAEIETKAEVIRIEQANDSLLDQMPSLEITSHIYSSQANRRSIVVNGERLAEGDFVAGQIQVKEITHQGMVLKVKDSLLAVSRSRGWSR